MKAQDSTTSTELLYLIPWGRRETPDLLLANSDLVGSIPGSYPTRSVIFSEPGPTGDRDMGEQDFLDLLKQAGPTLRHLSYGNYLFELADLEQEFLAAVVAAAPRARTDVPTPPKAFLYAHGMWGVKHYLRHQAKRGLQSTCTCGWHGSYQRQCPECNKVTTSDARKGELQDYDATTEEVYFKLKPQDIRRIAKEVGLTEAEERVFVAAAFEAFTGHEKMGYWKSVGQELNISNVRLMKLKRRLREKLEGVEL